MNLHENDVPIGDVSALDDEVDVPAASWVPMWRHGQAVGIPPILVAGVGCSVVQ